MDIRAALLKKHSKATADAIAGYVGTNATRFAVLLELLFDEEPTMAQRAAWPVGVVATENPNLLLPHFSRLMPLLVAPPHPAVARNLLRSLVELPEYPEEQAGILATVAFDYLNNPNTTVAVQVHSMQILFNLSGTYPELGQELREVLEAGIENGSPGYRNRAEKLLNRL